MKKKIAVISAAAALTMLMTVPASVSAAQTKTPAGYVVVAAEKFTIGQKFLSEPTKVPFYEGETGADISDRFFGEGNVNNGNPTGSYISAVADKDGASEASIPAFILDAAGKTGDTIENSRTDNAWLSGTDYCAMSGWFYGVNNIFASESISNYKPVDGDVVRVEFSVYGYGADIGMDNSSWGGSPALVTQADRDQLYTVMADVKDKFGSSIADGTLKTAYDNAYNASSDITITQDKIDQAYQELKAAYENAEIIVTTAVSQVTEPAVTTSSSSAVTSVSTTAAKKAVTTTSKTKASPATGESSSAMAFIIASCSLLVAGVASRKRSK